MCKVIVGKAQELTAKPEVLRGMFKLRHNVFYERLGWQVDSQNGLERDVYDELNPLYMIAQRDEHDVEGCWRILPTTGPYMLKNTFPQLLCGEETPSSRNIWEVSRFAVLPEGTCSSNPSQAPVHSTTLAMLRKAVEFADQNRISHYVAVTSVALEKLLKKVGVPMYRFGTKKAQKVGKVLSVACWIEVNDQFRNAVGIPMRSMETLREAA